VNIPLWNEEIEGEDLNVACSDRSGNNGNGEISNLCGYSICLLCYHNPADLPPGG
jgi:hypothetical protein